MSYIRGFHMDFMRLDKNSILLLKIMLILNTSIYIKTLNAIYNKSLHLSSNMDDSNFKIFINTLINRGFLGIDQYDYIHLNHNIISEDEIKITLVERLTISRDIIDIFERCKTELTISQLKFAIHNLDKDYSRRKSYILVLLKKCVKIRVDNTIRVQCFFEETALVSATPPPLTIPVVAVKGHNYQINSDRLFHPRGRVMHMGECVKVNKLGGILVI